MLSTLSLMIGSAVASALELAACLISAVLLFRHQKEMRDYTRVFLGCCAILLVTECFYKVIVISLFPESNPLTQLMHPYVVLLGLLAQILALVYPLRVLRPKAYLPFVLLFLPWALLAVLYFRTPAFTVLNSPADLRVHAGSYNVILRLVTIGCYIPYLVYLYILLLPGSINRVSVSRRYFIGYAIFVTVIAVFHFSLFFTGNPLFMIGREILVGALFFIMTLFDLEVRLFPKGWRSEDEPQAQSQENDVPMPSVLPVQDKSLQFVSRPLWERICQALDQDEVWRDPDLSVESLSRMCGSNVPYVIHCIKKETGYRPNEYINRKRIAYVCSRLEQDPDQNLQDVFFDAGYRVRTTAWRNFREIVGVTPSEYRFSKR